MSHPAPLGCGRIARNWIAHLNHARSFLSTAEIVEHLAVGSAAALAPRRIPIAATNPFYASQFGPGTSQPGISNNLRYGGRSHAASACASATGSGHSLLIADWWSLNFVFLRLVIPLRIEKTSSRGNLFELLNHPRSACKFIESKLERLKLGAGHVFHRHHGVEGFKIGRGIRVIDFVRVRIPSTHLLEFRNGAKFSDSSPGMFCFT